jgi:hypothetical protein
LGFDDKVNVLLIECAKKLQRLMLHVNRACGYFEHSRKSLEKSRFSILCDEAIVKMSLVDEEDGDLQTAIGMSLMQQ